MKTTAAIPWIRVALLAASCLVGLAVQATESLYKEGQFEALTADRRATKVGDLVTVLIYENSSASSTADTQAGRTVGVGLEVAGTVRRFRRSIGVTNDMDGRGQTDRANRLLAQVTVSIQEVLPNGDLRLGGEQMLEINAERQQIRLEGRIRGLDIQENNIVLSTRLADTRISYVGEGVLGDRQKPSWWQQLLTALGL